VQGNQRSRAEAGDRRSGRRPSYDQATPQGAGQSSSLPPGCPGALRALAPRDGGHRGPASPGGPAGSRRRRMRSIVDPVCDRDKHMVMAESASKNLRTPDETIRLPGITEELVDLGDLTVGRTVQEPGWRWSTHTRPVVGGQWCAARHVGVVLSGRFGVLLKDGTVLDFGARRLRHRIRARWLCHRRGAVRGYRVVGTGALRRPRGHHHRRRAAGDLQRSRAGPAPRGRDPPSRGPGWEGLQVRVGVHVGEMELVGAFRTWPAQTARPASLVTRSQVPCQATFARLRMRPRR
jgi:hypothetical protein